MTFSLFPRCISRSKCFATRSCDLAPSKKCMTPRNPKPADALYFLFWPPIRTSFYGDCSFFYVCNMMDYVRNISNRGALISRETYKSVINTTFDYHSLGGRNARYCITFTKCRYRSMYIDSKLLIMK